MVRVIGDLCDAHRHDGGRKSKLLWHFLDAKEFSHSKKICKKLMVGK
jgi:hypothetical protein